MQYHSPLGNKYDGQDSVESLECAQGDMPKDIRVEESFRPGKLVGETHGRCLDRRQEEGTQGPLGVHCSGRGRMSCRPAR